MSSKSNLSYESLIKVHGCPLLPPVIDGELRKEIKKYKEHAIALEQEISLRKISELERLSERSDDTLNQSVELDGCSEGTIKLIEYIKKALKDVAHDSNVEKLQSQFFDDLKKFEIEKAKGNDRSLVLSSNDTLQNVDTFSSEIENVKGYRPGESDTSSDAETLSPENPHLGDNALAVDETSSDIDEPRTPIRRKSFTLESPSPALIRYFQSLTKDGNTDLQDNFSPSNCKTSKNLNELWKNDSSYLDMSSMVLNSCETQNHDNFDKRTVNINQNINSLAEQETLSNNTSTPKSYLSCEKLGSSASPVSNNPYSSKNYSTKQQNAAARIQAGVRGYLVRRLLRTNKVTDLKKIICDSVVCAKKLHMEQSVTQADVTLHVRLIRQVTAACFELHSIFFEWPVKEQMALIRQDRIMTIKALARRRLSNADIMSKSDMKLPVTKQVISPRSGTPLHGSVMSASYPQDKASPTYLGLGKGCPTPS